MQQGQTVVAAGGVFVHNENVRKVGRNGGFQFPPGGDEAVDAGAAVEGIGGGLADASKPLQSFPLVSPDVCLAKYPRE